MIRVRGICVLRFRAWRAGVLALERTCAYSLTQSSCSIGASEARINQEHMNLVHAAGPSERRGVQVHIMQTIKPGASEHRDAPMQSGKI